VAKKNANELVSNRRAFHDYEILDTYEAGIVLQGTEIKSLRNHGGGLSESYVTVKKNELWLIGSFIAHYSHGNIHNHVERRDRKLLMHKQEIYRLKKQIQEKGLTIVALSMYLKKGRVKIKIGCAKGKKGYDKREHLKEKSQKKEIDRAMKELN